MKVILKNKKIITITHGKYSKFESTFETFDIVKEDGTNFESYDPHTAIDEYGGLEWNFSDITSLLEFLGIEYELQEDIEIQEEKE